MIVPHDAKIAKLFLYALLCECPIPLSLCACIKANLLTAAISGIVTHQAISSVCTSASSIPFTYVLNIYNTILTYANRRPNTAKHSCTDTDPH